MLEGGKLRRYNPTIVFGRKGASHTPLLPRPLNGASGSVQIPPNPPLPEEEKTSGRVRLDVPQEPGIERLWRCLGSLVSVLWLDRDVRYMALAYELAEPFGNVLRLTRGIRVLATREEETIELPIVCNRAGIVDPMIWAEGHRLYIRTNFKERVVEWLEQDRAGVKIVLKRMTDGGWRQCARIPEQAKLITM